MLVASLGATPPPPGHPAYAPPHVMRGKERVTVQGPHGNQQRAKCHMGSQGNGKFVCPKGSSNFWLYISVSH